MLVYLCSDKMHQQRFTNWIQILVINNRFDQLQYVILYVRDWCVYILPPPPHFFLFLSLAAVNPDVYTGSSALAPACRVPGVLSAVRDVRQQTGMA